MDSLSCPTCGAHPADIQTVDGLAHQCRICATFMAPPPVTIAVTEEKRSHDGDERPYRDGSCPTCGYGGGESPCPGCGGAF